MNVVFRLDASRRIGIGHYARCRVLADALSESMDAKCYFVGRDPDGLVAFRLRESDHRFLVVPEPAEPSSHDAGYPHSHWLLRPETEDAGIALELLEREGVRQADWVVVDHYGIGARWHSAVRPVARHILAIDDLADRPLVADMVLDQNLRFAAGNDYATRVVPGTRLLAGPRFALLRPEFASKEKVQRKQRHLFAAFGGADAENWTGRFLEAMHLMAPLDITADIAITSAHSELDALQETCASLAAATLHIDHHRVSRLMQGAVLGIGAGGSMTWERCASGLPSLTWAVAENQVASLAALERVHAVRLLEAADAASPRRLATAIIEMLEQPQTLHAMGQSCRSLCDGKGVERVLRSMQACELDVRLADETDTWPVFELRNSPAVRSTAFDREPISRETHGKWFEASLRDRDRVLLVGIWRDKLAGVLRYDRRGEAAEVSIFLSADFQRKSLGGALLAAGEPFAVDKLGVSRLFARTRPENQASVQFFMDAGFERKGAELERLLPRQEQA